MLAGRFKQAGTDNRRTAFFTDMGFIFIPEIAQRGQHRVRGGLSQTAQGRVLHDIGPPFQGWDVILLAFSVADAGQHFQHFLGSHPAGSTLAAGFLHAEFHEESCHVHHAFVVIHDDHAAGTNDGPQPHDRFIIHRCVQVLSRDASAGRATQLNGFKFIAVGDSSADVIDNIAKRYPHGYFDQTDVADIAGKGKDFCAFASQGTGVGIPLSAV